MHTVSEFVHVEALMASCTRSMAVSGTTAVDYDSFLKSLPTEQSRQNFLSACRVFFDNAAQALREVCKSEQRDCGLPLPTTNLLGSKGTSLSLLDIEFSALAKHLCNGKQRAEKYSGSFFVYLFEAKWFAATDSKAGSSSFLEVLPDQGRRSVDVASFDWSQLVEHKVYTHSQVSFMERVSNCPKQFRLLRPHDKKQKTVHVYLTKPHWAAVDKLREQRNKYVGHNSSTVLHTSDLVALFDDVKECYQILDVSKDIYKQLEEIEREHKLMRSAEEICRGLLQYRQVVMNEWTVMDQRLDKVEGEVAAVNEEIAGIKEDIAGLRDSQTKQTEDFEKLKGHIGSSQVKGELSVKFSATTESTEDKNKRAKDVFTKYYDDLRRAIEDPLVLAAKLKGQGYIGSSVVRNMQSVKGVSDDEKSIQLLNIIESLLTVHDNAYGELEKLMSILEEEGGAMKVVIRSMRAMLKEE